MDTLENFRQELITRAEKKLRRSLNPSVVRLLEDDRFFCDLYEDYQLGHGINSIRDQLLSKYKEVEKRFKEYATQQTKKTQPEKVITGDDHLLKERLLCLSKIIGEEAGKRPDVIWFRKNFLDSPPKPLLTLEDIPDWIDQYVSTESIRAKTKRSLRMKEYCDWEVLRAVYDLTYPAPWKPPLTGFRPDPPFQIAVVCVPYDHEVLQWLKKLTNVLIHRYSWWKEHEAVGFALTGEVPEIPKGRILSSSKPVPDMRQIHPDRKKAIELALLDNWDRLPEYDIVNLKIKLELNPFMSPNEVINEYKAARKDIFPQRQIHPIRGKAIELALFCAEHDTPDMTWDGLMNCWNTTPERKIKWRYKNYRTFCRDVRRAWKQIRGVPYSKEKR